MSLWADIDTYLATKLQAELGRGGDYTTLLVRKVEVNDAWRQDALDKANDYPFILVIGYRVTINVDEHGDSELHTGNIYEYWLIGVAKATTKNQARQDGQTLLSRMRKFLRERPVLNGLTTTDTERIQYIAPDRAEVEVSGRTDQTTGVYIAKAILHLMIATNN